MRQTEGEECGEEKDTICPRIGCQRALLTADVLLLKPAHTSFELSVILVTRQLLWVLAAPTCASRSWSWIPPVQTLSVGASVPVQATPGNTTLPIINKHPVYLPDQLRVIHLLMKALLRSKLLLGACRHAVSTHTHIHTALSKAQRHHGSHQCVPAAVHTSHIGHSAHLTSSS